MNQKTSPSYQLLSYANGCFAFVGEKGVSKRILKILMRCRLDYPINIEVHEGGISKEVAKVVNAMNESTHSEEERIVLTATKGTISIFATNITIDVRDRLIRALI